MEDLAGEPLARWQEVSEPLIAHNDVESPYLPGVGTPPRSPLSPRAPHSPQPWRTRRWPLRGIRLARSWALNARALANAALGAGENWGETVNAAIANNPRARTLLLRLKIALCCSWILSAIPAALQIWCAYRAYRLYYEHHGTEGQCSQLRHWLFGYFLLPLFLPCLALAIYVFIVWWVFIGGSLQEKMPHCAHEVPKIWSFMLEARCLTLYGCGCGLISFAVLIFAIKMSMRLRSYAQRRGPTPANVIDQLPILSSSQVDADAECPICLEHGSSNQQWMQLPCKHEFHEDCLRPWLAEAQVCPLCRHFLTES